MRTHSIVLDEWRTLNYVSLGKNITRRYNVLIHRNNTTGIFWGGFGKAPNKKNEIVKWYYQSTDRVEYDLLEDIMFHYDEHIRCLSNRIERRNA